TASGLLALVRRTPSRAATATGRCPSLSGTEQPAYFQRSTPPDASWARPALPPDSVSGGSRLASATFLSGLSRPSCRLPGLARRLPGLASRRACGLVRLSSSILGNALRLTERVADLALEDLLGLAHVIAHDGELVGLEMLRDLPHLL